MTGRFGAILLAGGRATRMGGEIKPLLEVGGRSMLARAADAVRDAGARPITVVAPVLDEGLDVDWVREDPPLSGPAAATITALESWGDESPEWTFLLACDLPRAGDVVARLAADILLLPSDTEGMCLADPTGRPQWLTGVYRTAALRTAASSVPDHGRDQPVRALLDDLAIAVVAVDPALVRDVDTWEDLEVARREEDR